LVSPILCGPGRCGRSSALGKCAIASLTHLTKKETANDGSYRLICVGVWSPVRRLTRALGRARSSFRRVRCAAPTATTLERLRSPYAPAASRPLRDALARPLWAGKRPTRRPKSRPDDKASMPQRGLSPSRISASAGTSRRAHRQHSLATDQAQDAVRAGGGLSQHRSRWRILHSTLAPQLTATIYARSKHDASVDRLTERDVEGLNTVTDRVDVMEGARGRAKTREFFAHQALEVSPATPAFEGAAS
jgi:hypothetical protein